VLYVVALAWFLINSVHHVSRFWAEPAHWPDLSYGIYLFGFPIQQALIAAFPQWNGWANLAASMCLTALVASVSWYLIEYPALRLKKRLR
jgi:peptidoglycan/LPS O-acetylase OafA/YrhL